MGCQTNHMQLVGNWKLKIENGKLEIEDWRLQKEKANYHQTTNTLVISPHLHVLIIYYST